MKKEYEKPTVEVVVLECVVVVTDASGDEATLDIGGWWV